VLTALATPIAAVIMAADRTTGINMQSTLERLRGPKKA
jgi:hypothetical protein